jgi:hypothetical protein
LKRDPFILGCQYSKIGECAVGTESIRMAERSRRENAFLKTIPLIEFINYELLWSPVIA